MRERLAKWAAAAFVLGATLFMIYLLHVRGEMVSSYDLIDLHTGQTIRSEQISIDEADRRNQWIAGSGRIWAMRDADATAFAAARLREATTTRPTTEQRSLAADETHRAGEMMSAEPEVAGKRKS